MYAQKEKPKDNKSKTVSNSVTQNKSNKRQGFGFFDNLSEAIAKMKRIETVNNGRTSPIQMAPAGKYNAGYKLQVDKDFHREREIGKRLSSDSRLTKVAANIRTLTGSPQNYESLADQTREHVDTDVGTMAGAHEFRTNQPTLDAHAYATHTLIHDPKFNDPSIREKRKNRFNRIDNPRNPLFPTNNRKHDMNLHEVTDYKDYPESMVKLMRARGIDPQVLAASGEQERMRVIAKHNLKKSTDTWRGDMDITKASPTNPVNTRYRAHDVGDNANVVPVRGQSDKAAVDWSREAIARKRPIISGPSGHSLRYMNHWAETRRKAIANGQDISNWPPLEDARLVCLGNLLPPKHHHSYHEIMTASIGVTDGQSSLGYNYPNDYNDLQASAIGRKAHDGAEEASIPVEHRRHEKRHNASFNRTSPDNPLNQSQVLSEPAIQDISSSSPKETSERSKAPGKSSHGSLAREGIRARDPKADRGTRHDSRHYDQTLHNRAWR
jgi:hypothetical protein